MKKYGNFKKMGGYSFTEVKTKNLTFATDHHSSHLWQALLELRVRSF
ncbi:MAG: hypothetical protein ACE5KJ_03210 [Candidatus Zixiibacteriota bacterium]